MNRQFVMYLINIINYQTLCPNPYSRLGCGRHHCPRHIRNGSFLILMPSQLFPDSTFGKNHYYLLKQKKTRSIYHCHSHLGNGITYSVVVNTSSGTLHTENVDYYQSEEDKNFNCHPQIGNSTSFTNYIAVTLLFPYSSSTFNNRRWKLSGVRFIINIIII